MVQLYQTCRRPAVRPRRRGRPFPRRLQQRPRCGASACTVAKVASPRPLRSSPGPEAPPCVGVRHPPWPGTPQAPAVQRQEAPAAMEAWVEGSGHRRRDGTPVPVEVRGRRRCNTATRCALLLGALPQPVSHQPDVTRLFRYSSKTSRDLSANGTIGRKPRIVRGVWRCIAPSFR